MDTSLCFFWHAVCEMVILASRSLKMADDRRLRRDVKRHLRQWTVTSTIDIHDVSKHNGLSFHVT